MGFVGAVFCSAWTNDEVGIKLHEHYMRFKYGDITYHVVFTLSLVVGVALPWGSLRVVYSRRHCGRALGGLGIDCIVSRVFAELVFDHFWNKRPFRLFKHSSVIPIEFTISCTGELQL